ncbi:MAG: DNA polymerase III subunit gamma/tau [Spirochaetales bacterium]|nr:DNA polymerase III subunit gamma/tau [Spirochaetales bacterium]
MAYEVTATKKRPHLFDDVAGQDFVVSTLKNSINSDRLAHAYLFSGPRGVGKTSAARILARAVNCQEGPTSSPCGVCSSCVEISRGNSLDVIEIDGASNTSVNDIREIRDEVLFAPNASRYKVYIIDEVHMLSNSAFNALLKTIEEPPPYIIFIFATTEIHKVPATIRSRCQQFNFRLIPVEVIRDLLKNVCEEFGITAEDDALFWIAREATGSQRDAYTLFDQVAAFSDGHITTEKIREKLGLVGIDNLNELLEDLIDNNIAGVMEKLDGVLSQGVPVEQFIVDLTEYFRNILFIRHGITREALLGQSVSRFSTRVIEAFTVSQLELAVELLLKLFRDIRFSLNQRYELELLLSRISGLSSYLTPAEMYEQIHTLKDDLKNGAWGVPAASAGESEAEVPEETGPPPFDNEAVRDELLNFMKKKKLTLFSALEKSTQWKKEDEDLLMVFDHDFTAQLVRAEKRVIEDQIFEISGHRVKLSIKVEEAREEESSVFKDESIENVKKVFRGEVIGGE